MPLVALISTAADPGGKTPARTLLEGLESPRVLVGPGPDGVEAASEVAPGRPVAEVPDLHGPRPGESPADLLARVRAGLVAALPEDVAAVVAVDPRVIAALTADVLGLAPEDADSITPDPAGVSLLRRLGDDLLLAGLNLMPIALPPERAAVRRRLHLLRHAETDTVTPDGRMFSHAPLPLTDRGRRQAAAVGERLADVETAVVHASDIVRTAETAEAVAGRRRAVELHAGLREIPLGDFEGAHALELFSASPGFLTDPDVGLPGGESPREVGDRAGAALDAILASSDDRDVIVVAHGGVNRALLGRLLEVPLESALRIRQDWACVNLLEQVDGRWRPRTLNWTPAGLDEFAYARRVAPAQGPNAPGAHVIDWRTA